MNSKSYLRIAVSLLAALVVIGCPNKKSKDIPEARIDADIRLGDAPLAVQFSSTSIENGSPIIGWQWNLGDGATSIEANPQHTYTNPGTYSVTLTVTAQNGQTDELREANYIIARNPAREVGTVAGEQRQFSGIDFVWIPAGSFTMGAEDPTIYWNSDAIPQHTVTISQGFWMGKYEVTQTQWLAVGMTNLSSFQSTRARMPVDTASWDEAQEFVRRMNALGEGVYRLPTEAEWEYACRAGTTTQYSFGDDPVGIYTHGWVWENARYQTFPVGSLLPNPWGLYDMHGNVWEWVLDWYDEAYYTANAVTDPLGPDRRLFRVVRGGSWYHAPHLAASSSRFYYLEVTQYNIIGLRLVRQ